MTKAGDIRFMKRAISLSLKGIGNVNPNPLVGAVIVKDGVVIGEGCHEKYGGPHAEVNAINNAITNVEGATMYVTLEPCNHQGKTPPCTDLILKGEIARVVVAMTDPNRLVAGKGIGKLLNNGVEVETGLLADEVEVLNEVYLKYITTKQPFCILKTAMTLDGKIATPSGDSKWISNEKSRAFVHQLRHRYSGIMVGVNTIINDNPELTVRSKTNTSQPIRIVVDSSGRTPIPSKVFNTKKARTIVAITQRASQGFISQMVSKGVQCILCPEKNNRVDLSYLFTELGKLEIDSILLEGGGTLNFSAIGDGLVDKLYSFISPKIIGGCKSKTPVGGKGVENINDAFILDIKNVTRFNEDIMIESYLIHR